MRKGIVFTLDAVVGILIMIMFVAMIMTIIEVESQEDNTLYLSRLARDSYEIKYYNPGAQLPSWVLEDAECKDSKDAGSERAVVYASGGRLTTVTTRVCLEGV